MRRILSLILIVGILAIQYTPFVQAASSATLKTWHYLGMKAQLQDFLSLLPGEKIYQGFTPPRTWTVDKISLYAEYAEGVDSAEKERNVTLQSYSHVLR